MTRLPFSVQRSAFSLFLFALLAAAAPLRAQLAIFPSRGVDLASPPSIGNVTPNTGAFTTLFSGVVSDDGSGAALQASGASLNAGISHAFQANALSLGDNTNAGNALFVYNNQDDTQGAFVIGAGSAGNPATFQGLNGTFTQYQAMSFQPYGGAALIGTLSDNGSGDLLQVAGGADFSAAVTAVNGNGIVTNGVNIYSTGGGTFYGFVGYNSMNDLSGNSQTGILLQSAISGASMLFGDNGQILIGPSSGANIAIGSDGRITAPSFSGGVKTAEGDTFYAHTVAGNLVWTTSP